MSEPKVKKSEYTSAVLALMHVLLAPARPYLFGSRV
jgi:hypothetical protein